MYFQEHISTVASGTNISNFSAHFFMHYFLYPFYGNVNEIYHTGREID